MVMIAAPTVDIEKMGRAARVASRQLATCSTNAKNAALLKIADLLEARLDVILAANAQDMADGRARGLTPALLDRLLLTEARIRALAADARSVAALPDPVGAEIEGRLLPNGMRLSRRRIPIGVLGVIYEARPNVTIDIATLCLKTGNAVILRGGSETLRSNLALAETIQEALAAASFPRAAIQYVDSPDRALVTQLLRLDRYVDMIIPRAGDDPGHHRRHRRVTPLCRRQRGFAARARYCRECARTAPKRVQLVRHGIGASRRGRGMAADVGGTDGAVPGRAARGGRCA